MRVYAPALFIGVVVASCHDGNAASPANNTSISAIDGGVVAVDAAKPDAVAIAGALCVDGKPTAAYPPEPYSMSVLGVLPKGTTLTGADDKPFVIDQFFDPCAAKPKLLVIRSSATWCGPCQWHAAHSKRFMDDEPLLAQRITLLDVLIADEDNNPATPQALTQWASKIDLNSKDGLLAVDPDFTFAPAQLSRGALPLFVLVDPRTMQIRAALNDPDPESLVNRLIIEVADLDGTPEPAVIAPTLIDDLFTENQMDLIRAMKLPADPADAAPPPDPTNEFADSPAAATLGKALFSDTLLSPTGTVACVTCHDSALDFTDGANQSTGVAKGDRNAPSISLASHSRWQFWDGRADTLWMQALLPPEDAKEIASSRLFIAHQIATRYQAQYDAAFGAKYTLPVVDLAAMPAAGKPGDAAYDALSAADKDKVTRVYVNFGKAIAAFERAIRVKPNALDQYADGDMAALSQDEKHALKLFFQEGCAQCHWGPRLTDDAFHNVRFGTGRQDGQADHGREVGLTKLVAGEFLASSMWSDAPASAKATNANPAAMLGTFKTPTLRGVAATAPYGHGGTLSTLQLVTHQYGIRGLDHADPSSIGTTEQWVPMFDANAQAELPAFLDVLTAAVVLPP